MSAPFDFEAFISGVTVDLPREQVPIYTVIHQARIDEINDRIHEFNQQIDDLNDQIAAASDPDAPGADERESSSGATALAKERDRIIKDRDRLPKERDLLIKEQDDSAKWITLRCLSAQEYADEVAPDSKNVIDQIAAQTQGTGNEMSREDVERLRATVLHGAWNVLVENANRIVIQRMVMPDFSRTTSASRSTPES